MRWFKFKLFLCVLFLVAYHYGWNRLMGWIVAAAFVMGFLEFSLRR